MTDAQIARLLRSLQDGGEKVVVSDRKLPVQVHVSSEIGTGDLLHLYEDPAAGPLTASRLAEFLYYGVNVIVFGRDGMPRTQVTGAEDAGSLRSFGQVVSLTGERVPR